MQQDKKKYIFINYSFLTMTIFISSLFSYKINNFDTDILFILESNLVGILGLISFIFTPIKIKYLLGTYLDLSIIIINFIILLGLYNYFYINNKIKYGYILTILFILSCLSVGFFLRFIIFAV